MRGGDYLNEIYPVDCKKVIIKKEYYLLWISKTDRLYENRFHVKTNALIGQRELTGRTKEIMLNTYEGC